MAKQILIIDDDEELCDGIAEILHDEGYCVKNTSDADEAGKLIENCVFDIALVDYKMPKLTGVDVLRLIKAKNPATRVFIVSGRPFIEKLLEDEKVAHLVAGVISKPFDCQELLERILENGGKK